jgi:hypothetical protein
MHFSRKLTTFHEPDVPDRGSPNRSMSANPPLWVNTHALACSGLPRIGDPRSVRTAVRRTAASPPTPRSGQTPTPLLIRDCCGSAIRAPFGPRFAEPQRVRQPPAPGERPRFGRFRSAADRRSALRSDCGLPNRSVSTNPPRLVSAHASGGWGMLRIGDPRSIRTAVRRTAACPPTPRAW